MPKEEVADELLSIPVFFRVHGKKCGFTSRQAVYRAITGGRFPAVRTGSRLYISWPSAYEFFIARQYETFPEGQRPKASEPSGVQRLPLALAADTAEALAKQLRTLSEAAA